MSDVDYARYERVTFGGERRREGLRLTPEILGQVVACSLQAGGEAAMDDLDGGIEGFLLRHRAAAPPALAEVLYVERRVDGEFLEDATQMTLGAQDVNLIGRMNPTHVMVVEKTDRVQAYALLMQLEAQFPETVAWVRKHLREELQKGDVPNS